jgi:hypothetical protein
VKDVLKVSQPQSVQEKKLLVLYSDAAAYMLKAATAVKVFLSKFNYFTCMSHGLQRVVEQVRSNFPDIIKLISSTKEVVVKVP